MESKVRVVKASDMKKPKKLSTGCPVLDAQMSGGLPLLGVTEIYGESGSGKSQLAMQLALSCQLPEKYGGLGGGSVYISTQGPFPLKRLVQIIDRFSGKNRSKREFEENVYITHTYTLRSLGRCFDKLELLVKCYNIKLFILDNIASLLRGTPDGEGRRKVENLRKMRLYLNMLNVKYGVVTVCINQVTCCLRTGNDQTPALGWAWENLVTTRIKLRKNLNCKMLRVVFSPEIPQIEVPFLISDKGIDAF